MAKHTSPPFVTNLDYSIYTQILGEKQPEIRRNFDSVAIFRRAVYCIINDRHHLGKI
jgi:hypothetical protein